MTTKIQLTRVGFITILLTAIAIVCIFSFSKKASKPMKATDPAKGFAVVELFTSEGCSSCPAADEVVTKLSAAYIENVFVLGFHVDYYNRLGWKDEFSKSIYSDRQRNYAETFKLDEMYTPQVIVNGKKELVGSDAAKLKNLVAAELQNDVNASIRLTAATGTSQVKVAWQIEKTGNSTLHVALVQVQTQTNVRKGENEGRQLKHINIVRDFLSIDAQQQNGTASLSLPAGIGFDECKVIACLQQNKTAVITGSASTSISQ